jgi:hypothetical protein
LIACAQPLRQLHRLPRPLQKKASALQQRNTEASSSSAPSLEGRDLLKIIPKPETLKADSSDDFSRWHEWFWSFKNYISAICPQIKDELSLVEANPETALGTLSGEALARSNLLYSLLASMTKGRAFQIIKQLPPGQGFEALRLLVLYYQPPSRVRALGLLGALTSLKAFSPKEPMLQQLLELERAFDAYEKASGSSLADDLKSALLLKSLPFKVKQHISGILPENAAYAQPREAILKHERTQQQWSSSALWGTSSLFATGPEPTPMDIGRIKGKAKGKGKGNNHKGKDKGNAKGKDKGNHPKGKGKGNNPKGKGKGQGQNNKQDIVCLFCNKKGHYSAERRSNPNRVNQVNAEAKASGAAGSQPRCLLQQSRPQLLLTLSAECLTFPAWILTVRGQSA